MLSWALEGIQLSHAAPWNIRRSVLPDTQPASVPTPGAVSLAAAAATRSARPAT